MRFFVQFYDIYLIVKYDIEREYLNIISLWMFGLNY